MNIVEGFYSLFHRIYLNLVNKRLRSKLFLVYLLVTILPVSFFIFYSYQTIKDQLVRQAVQNVGSTIDQINNNIANKLDMYSQISTMIYLDKELRNYLLNDYNESGLSNLDAYDYINKSLYKMLAMNPNLKSITIYTDNRSLHSDGYFVKYMDELNEDSIDRLMQAEGNIAYFYPANPPGGGKVITLARSLNYLSLNYPYGILTMDIAEREIYSLIEKESSTKTIIVADEHGNPITSGRNDSGIRNLSDLEPAGQPAFAAYEGGPYYSEIGGERTLVISKSLENGWRTVVLLPYGELLGQAQQASRKMLYISLACIAVAIVLIYGTSQLMTKRFELLLQQIRKVERGSFDLNFQPMGNDEVGQLSFALKKMAVTIQDLINDVYKKEVLKNEAEMTSLQAQITPHFLYNSLASISALAVKNNNTKVHRMADDLARFYRISLNKGKKYISIEQEIKLTEHYLSIQKTRFEGLLTVHYAIDNSLLCCTTLKLIMQPFIENCINHAVWDDECGINIIIKLASDGNDLLLSVIDDGMGMPGPVLERIMDKSDQPAGYGIYNVDKRIKLAYGERYGVTVHSRLGIGTSVRLRIPKTTMYP